MKVVAMTVISFLIVITEKISKFVYIWPQILYFCKKPAHLRAEYFELQSSCKRLSHTAYTNYVAITELNVQTIIKGGEILKFEKSTNTFLRELNCKDQFFMRRIFLQYTFPHFTVRGNLIFLPIHFQTVI